MSEVTTIPITKTTRDKIREFARKSESWEDVLNRLYSTALSVQAAQVFFSDDAMSGKELLRRIEKW